MIDRLKIKNKKGFLTRDFIMAGVLFSGMIALFVLSIAGIQDEYDSTLLTDEDFAENYDRLTEQVGKVETARKAAAAGEGLSFLGTFDVTFQSTFVVFQMIYSTLDLFNDMTSTFAEDFGLDPTVTSIAFTIGLVLLTIVIVWGIVSSISRGRF